MNFIVTRGAYRKAEFTQEQKKYIIQEYLEKKATISELGKRFNISSSIIKRILNDNNAYSKEAGRKSKYNVNENFFQTINTEEKAYWLGFLCADGSVIEHKNNMTLSMSLAEVDKTHLKKLIKSLDSTHPVNSYNSKIGSKTYPMNYISIRNKKLCEDIISKGCIPRKTLTLEFPKEHQVPVHLLNHFIRGYFDGDGCISYYMHNGKYRTSKKYEMYILGTEDFLIGVADHLNTKNRPEKTKHNCYILRIRGSNQVKRALENIYKNANIYLDRKKKKVEEFYEYHQSIPTHHWHKDRDALEINSK